MPALMLVLALSVFAVGAGNPRPAGASGLAPSRCPLTARTAYGGPGARGLPVGAVVGGFYLGVAVALSPSWEIAYVRGLILAALVTVLGSGLLVAAGLWLERVCRIPPSDDDVEDRAA